MTKPAYAIYRGLLDEIRAELERGLGATVEPKELTPEEKREAKEFLDDLFGGEE